MARKRKSLEPEKVRVTPTLAKEWLEKNTANNRSVSQAVVDRYAADIQKHEWALTGDSIKFDWNGDLIDGQHRLLACIKAGKAFETIVIYGVAPEAFTKMDQNRVRTAGQILGMQDFSYSTTVAATVTAVKNIQRCIETGNYPKTMGWSSNIRVSPDEVLSFARKHNDLLMEAVTTVKSKESRRILKPPSTFAGIYFILAQGNTQRTREFFHNLSTGLMLASGDPIYQLRAALQDAVLDTRAKRTSPWKTAITIKAWNLWLNDKKTEQLRFRTANEKFPKPRKRSSPTPPSNEDMFDEGEEA